MDFTFDEDQELFRSTLRDFLAKECTPEHVRERWAAGASHDPALWKKLAALGIPGLLVPESLDGLGQDEVTAVLLFEEMGRAALPEPVIATAAVAAPLLCDLGGGGARLCRRIARGDARVAVRHPWSPFTTDADVADRLLWIESDAVYALDPSAAHPVHEPANDPSRRLFSLGARPRDAECLAEGAEARALAAAALDRGALAAAAEQLGVADRLIELSVAYASERKQFGQPVGAFQAVKHLLADCEVSLEYARPAVQRAAASVAGGHADRGLHVSMAKVLAGRAAQRSAGTALQVHGAIGYTWEQDLHLWMRRSWSLERTFGDSALHWGRIEASVFAEGARLGCGETFGDGGGWREAPRTAPEEDSTWQRPT